MKKSIAASIDVPTVGVIIPFYNSNDTIDKTIKSILDQTFEDFEVIVCVDKNSEKPKIKSLDPRIRIVQNTEKPGAGNSRFCAIQATESRFVAFIDADDEWVPSKLETQLNHMQNEKFVFSFTGYSTQKDGSLIAKYTPSGNVDLQRFLTKKITICCSSVIIDRESDPPIIRPYLKKRNDYQMWYPILKFALSNNKKCGYLKDILTIRNEHENNLTRNKITLPYYNYIFYQSIFQSRYKALLYCSLNILHTIFTKIKSAQKFK